MSDPRIREVLYLNCGAIVVYGPNGQIPELQEPWPVLWAKHAEATGYNPDGLVLQGPSFRFRFRIFKTDAGWNWDVL